MKFNKRLARDELDGDGTLTKEDILEVMKTLVDIRNGKQNCDDRPFRK
jgi:DNA-directed RNA polymerase subunit beta